MTQFQILCKLVSRHSYTSNNLYPDGKNCTVPVLHRDFYVAKDEVPWPALRQVTPTNFIAGPLLASCDKLDTCVILTNFCNFGKISSR